MSPPLIDIKSAAQRYNAGWVWDGVAPEAVRVGPGNRLITPGLINFHAHLELSDIQPIAYSGSFIGWLGSVMRGGPQDAVAATKAAVRGAAESLKYGVTEVVDITRFPGEVRAALANTGIRVRSCGEVTGLAGRVAKGESLIRAACMPGKDSQITVGISPHAPYSTDGRWFSQAAKVTKEQALTLTTHLCETPEEREFLANQTGMFREMWNRIGDWNDTVAKYPDGPVKWLEKLGVLQNTHLIAAHVNDVTDEELTLLSHHRVTIVHCPRTHAYFQRPPFEINRYLSAGLTVKLGTDSVASSGNLDLMEDVRAFAKINPQLNLGTLLGMATQATHELRDVCVWKAERLDDLLKQPGLHPDEVWIDGLQVA